MNPSLVVDASAIVDMLLGAPTASKIVEALAEENLHAPAHLDLEVMSALARLERSGTVPPRESVEMLSEFNSMPVERHPLAGMRAEVWQMRNQLWVSDAFYVALAGQLQTVVLTTDARLARATSVALFIGD
jgi:predicted nucleic acid-binding protein